MSDNTFEALPLAAPIQRALREKGYQNPSPVQAEAIPLLLEGRDLLACAQTGTGKTAAFALPILHKLHTQPRPVQSRQPRALILTPTRELAVQVGDSFATYGRYVRVRQALVFGGVSAVPQIKALRQGVDILVATPGRLMDLMSQGHIDLSRVEFFVLDEVDRMLDMGFLPDVRRIVQRLAVERQSLFFSATLAPEMVRLAEGILTDPARVTVAPQATTAERVEQQIRFVDKADKIAVLKHLLEEQEDLEGKRLTLVFTRTKHGADKLAKVLRRDGFFADAIHGNKSQNARQRALEDFRRGRSPILVATDVAARGIDVKDIALVVNYDLPNEPESYVHRIGRTARAGAEGLAISFCSAEEVPFLRDIERLIRAKIGVFDAHEFHSQKIMARYESGSNYAGGGQRPQRGGGQRGPSGPRGGGRGPGSNRPYGGGRPQGRPSRSQHSGEGQSAASSAAPRRRNRGQSPASSTAR